MGRPSLRYDSRVQGWVICGKGGSKVATFLDSGVFKVESGGITLVSGTFNHGADGTPAGDAYFYGTGANNRVFFDKDADTEGRWFFGKDTYGLDVVFYGATTANVMLWDKSADALVFTASGITMGTGSKFVLPVKASGSTTSGDIWLDTTDNKIHFYNGAAAGEQAVTSGNP